MSNKEQYNEIPIHYCNGCLSIKIERFNKDIDICMDCGSTNIVSSPLKIWEKIYEIEYGTTFLKEKKQ